MSIDAMPAGPELVAALASVDVASLTPSAALGLLQVHQRAVAWLDSVQAQLLVAAAQERPRVDEFVVEGWFDHGDSEYVRTMKVTDSNRRSLRRCGGHRGQRRTASTPRDSWPGH